MNDKGQQQPLITDNYGRDNKGRFAPGNTGRRPGSRNRSTNELKALIYDFLSDKLPNLEEVYQGLQPKDQAQMIIHLAKLVIPRQTEEIAPSNHIDLSDLSTDEIKALLRE
jgi:hypothetical protein